MHAPESVHVRICAVMPVGNAGADETAFSTTSQECSRACAARVSRRLRENAADKMDETEVW